MFSFTLATFFFPNASSPMWNVLSWSGRLEYLLDLCYHYYSISRPSCDCQMRKHSSGGGEKLQTDKWHQWAVLDASQESFLGTNLKKVPVMHWDNFYLLYVNTKLTFFLSSKDNSRSFYYLLEEVKLKLFLQVFLQVPLRRNFLHYTHSSMVFTQPGRFCLPTRGFRCFLIFSISIVSATFKFLYPSQCLSIHVNIQHCLKLGNVIMSLW